MLETSAVESAVNGICYHFLYSIAFVILSLFKHPSISKRIWMCLFPWHFSKTFSHVIQTKSIEP